MPDPINISLQPYAKRHYNVNGSLDFKILEDYIRVVLAIAGADGEISQEELDWFIDEQIMIGGKGELLIQAIQDFDRNSINLEEELNKFKNGHNKYASRTVLYQAIKMSRADREYHKDEQSAVRKAAELLGVETETVHALEELAEEEDRADQKRFRLLGTLMRGGGAGSFL